jgi:hypothetical protein
VDRKTNLFINERKDNKFYSANSHCDLSFLNYQPPLSFKATTYTIVISCRSITLLYANCALALDRKLVEYNEFISIDLSILDEPKDIMVVQSKPYAGSPDGV